MKTVEVKVAQDHVESLGEEKGDAAEKGNNELRLGGEGLLPTPRSHRPVRALSLIHI